MTLAKDQLSQENDVDIVLLTEIQDVSTHVPAACNVVRFRKSRLKSTLRPLIKYIKQEKPDVIVASMWPITVLAILANVLAGNKSRVVVSDHNPLSIQYAKWGYLHKVILHASIWLTYRFASARVGVSQGVANDVAKIAGLKPSKFEVIYNPMSLPKKTSNGKALAQKAWGGWDGKRILTAGRFKTQKNHKLLIAAFKKMLHTQEAKLMLLGTGELLAETEAFIKSEGMEEHVILAGQVQSPAEFYESADLFVLSSNYEGFGNVIVEAMSLGCPIVSTDCPGGPAEILADGEYGKLVPVNDFDALAKAMAQALTEPTDKRKLQQRASEISGKKSLQQYADIFERK